jgi:hypothetical protein
LAAGATGAAAVLLGLAAPAQASTLDSIDISAGQVASGSYTVPIGYCSVQWSLSGAGGGAGYDANTGGQGNAGLGGWLSATTPVTAGQIITLVTGTKGHDASATGHGTGGGTGATAGANGEDQLDGSSAIVGGGGGGGGATSVSVAGHSLVARGGDGGEADGTAGGTGGNGAANTVNWDGVTEVDSEPTAGTDGDGSINGTVNPCPEGPGAPTNVSTTGGNREATVNFSPNQDGAWADSWQYSLDGGTWTDVTVDGDSDHWFTITGLTNGRSYSVQVRGVDTETTPGSPVFGDSSTAASVTPAAPNGAPTHVTVTPGPASYVVTWDAPKTSGTFPVAGYVVGWSGGQMGGALCENVPVTAARRCVGAAVPGAKYTVSVRAIDSKGNWGDPSASVPVGTVAAPTVPAAPPTTADKLVLPSGATSDVAAGATMKLTGHGYLPNSTVSVIIYSSPKVLTSVPTDATGSFTVTVTVPKDLESGHHTLVASGVDPTGAVRYTTLPVTVSGGKAAAPSLAYTGVDVTLPLTGGLIALVAGGALMVVARRRKAADAAV